MVHQTTLEIATSGRGLIDITTRVAHFVLASGMASGLCTLFVQHTSASLLVQENASAAVRRDLERWIDWVAAECPSFNGGRWEHDEEGPDDMPAHVRAAILKTSETIPVTDGSLALGTWQAIYLWEHRTSPHHRTVHVTLLG